MGCKTIKQMVDTLHRDMSGPPVLARIAAEDFEVGLGFLPTPAACREGLLSTPEVTEIRQSLRSGELTGTEVESFVEGLLLSFEKGVRFPFDVALAAVAVAVEGFYSPSRSRSCGALRRRAWRRCRWRSGWQPYASAATPAAGPGLDTLESCKVRGRMWERASIP